MHCIINSISDDYMALPGARSSHDIHSDQTIDHSSKIGSAMAASQYIN